MFGSMGGGGLGALGGQFLGNALQMAKQPGMENGLIGKLMSDNPGGLLGAIMGKGGAPAPGVGPTGPVLPTAAPGKPAGLGGMGMLSKLLPMLMGRGAGPVAPFGMDPNSNMPITADVAMGARGAMMPRNMGGPGPSPTALTGLW